MNPAFLPAGLEFASSAILQWIAQALIWGTVVALLTGLLTRAFRHRIHPRFEVLLWCIVLLKFLIPIGPGASLSLATTVGQLAHQTAPGTVLAEFAEPDFVNPYPANTTSQDQPLPPPPTPIAQWPLFLVATYLLVVIALAELRLRTYQTFRARCLALPQANNHTHKLVYTVCRRLGVPRVPLIRIDDESHAPFVMGLVRPILVLSRRQLVRPDELETVIVHEVSHLRRGDLFVRVLQCLAGTLLFFWPLVAWVNRRVDRAREHACDEWALRYGRLTASQYARCVLDAGRTLTTARLGYQPACMAGHPSTIERRIDVILALPNRTNKQSTRNLLAAAVVLVWGGFTLTGATPVKTKAPQYAATSDDMTRHAKAVYARVNQFAAGDQDDDDQVSKEECWSFVTAVVLSRPAAVLQAYPQADHNQDGTLDVAEAYFFVRGDHDIERVHQEVKRAYAEAEKAGDLERAKQIEAGVKTAEIKAWHMILDRRDALLDLMDVEPNLEEVQAICEHMAKIEKKKSRESLDKWISEVATLKQEAAHLRAEAVNLSETEAAAYRDKAAKMEQKAEEIKTKLAASLKENINKLESVGKFAEAEALKAALAKLEQL